VKILLTNHQLSELYGSETAAYAMACALRRQKHEVYVFTTIAGTFAEHFRTEKFYFTTNLLEWKDEKFDVAHVHHNTCAKIVRDIFPKLPILFLSHGPFHPLERVPPKEINVAVYLGVSEEVCLKMQKEECIQHPFVFRNSVDCKRFFPTSKINKTPERVLVLSNHFVGERLEILKAACEKANAGKPFLVGMETSSVWEVEKRINASDLVVSIGRGCLEAMACGRAVLLYDHNGCDGMMTKESYPEIRTCNFSGRKYKKEMTVDSLVEMIKSYRQEMGEVNVRIVKQNHDIDKKIEDLVWFYCMAMG